MEGNYREMDPKEAEKRADIIRNTPEGYDPVMYWHQVAMDAIRSSNKLQPALKQAKWERDHARGEVRRFTERLISENAHARKTTPLDLTNLITMAQEGKINVNLNISITSGAKQGSADFEEDNYDD